MRKKGELRYDDIFSEEGDSIDNMADEKEGPETQLLIKARRELVEKALSKLSADKREVLTLMTYSELSYKEIQEITGKSVANLKVVYHRAKKELIEKIKEMDEL